MSSKHSFKQSLSICANIESVVFKISAAFACSKQGSVADVEVHSEGKGIMALTLKNVNDEQNLRD